MNTLIIILCTLGLVGIVVWALRLASAESQARRQWGEDMRHNTTIGKQVIPNPDRRDRRT